MNAKGSKIGNYVSELAETYQEAIGAIAHQVIN